MKVIHILDELKFSGAEVMYVAAAPVFQELGCELSVVNSAKNLGAYTPFFEKAGYQVFHKPYPKFPVKRWIYYINFICFLKRNHYDLMHIHTNLWGMAFCAWMAGCSSIATFHSVFYSRKITRWYYRWQRWSAKNIFRCTFQTIGDSVYEQEKTYWHNDSVKIYNWYNSNCYFPVQEGEKEAARTELNIGKDILVLISIGSCRELKRHSDIIKAVSRIVKEYPDVLYLHLGEGEMLAEEQKLATSLHLSDNIRFCGNQTDVRKFLIASDIYLMTSRVEGVSITAIEVMACKVPSVFYNVPGLRDFNRERECNCLVPEDPGLLAENIIRIYEDHSKQKELTDNARRLVDSCFDMKTNAVKIFNLYQESKKCN
jgi:glycosyltransferase involved in cell wall biosynthesis